MFRKLQQFASPISVVCNTDQAACMAEEVLFCRLSAEPEVKWHSEKNQTKLLKWQIELFSLPWDSLTFCAVDYWCIVCRWWVPLLKCSLFSSCLGGRIHHHFFLFLFSFSREDIQKGRQDKKKKSPWQPTQSNPFPRAMKTHRIQASSWGSLLFRCVLHTCSLNTNIFFLWINPSPKPARLIQFCVLLEKFSVFIMGPSVGSSQVIPSKWKRLQGSPSTPFISYWVTWFP